MVNILDRSRRIRQVPGQLMPETTIYYNLDFNHLLILIYLKSLTREV